MSGAPRCVSLGCFPEPQSSLPNHHPIFLPGCVGYSPRASDLRGRTPPRWTSWNPGMRFDSHHSHPSPDPVSWTHHRCQKEICPLPPYWPLWGSGKTTYFPTNGLSTTPFPPRKGAPCSCGIQRQLAILRETLPGHRVRQDPLRKHCAFPSWHPVKPTRTFSCVTI